MKKQELFDKVSKHLLTQYATSQNSSRDCLYRHGNLSCAIGCLIKDEEYSHEMEGIDAVNLILDYGDKLSFVKEFEIETGNDYLFLSELQDIHDTGQPSRWQSRLMTLANNHNLTFNPNY